MTFKYFYSCNINIKPFCSIIALKSLKEQKRFILKVHNTLPFGSAIILDGDLESGTIQIETKPYKVGIRKSFAFEICNNNRSFYNTLKTSYYSLITDGLSQDDLFSKL